MVDYIEGPFQLDGAILFRGDALGIEHPVCIDGVVGTIGLATFRAKLCFTSTVIAVSLISFMRVSVLRAHGAHDDPRVALLMRIPRGTLVDEDAAYGNVRGAYELALVKSPPSFFSPKTRGSCRTPGRTLGMPEGPQLALASSAAMIDPRGR